MINEPEESTPSSEPSGFELKNRRLEQTPLFSTEDLIIPSSIRNIKKSISAVHSIPTSKFGSPLNTRRLFDACILAAQIDFKSRRDLSIERITKERVSPQFEIRIKDLVELAGIPGKNYQRIYDDLDALYELSMKWNVIGDDDEVIWEKKSHFLSSLGIGKGSKKGVVQFSIDPEVLSIILEPKTWASLSLQVLHSLKSAAAYALYQNTFRYINTNKKVTASLPTATWIQLMLGPSRFVKTDPKTKETKIDYKEFKRSYLIPAISEINSCPELQYSIEMKERKAGNRVSQLQFQFVPKVQESLDLPVTWGEETIKILKDQIGLLDQEISDLSQGFAFEEIVETLSRLQVQESKIKSQGGHISSKKNYFKGILQNITALRENKMSEQQLSDAVASREAEEAAERRKTKQLLAFGDHQLKVFTKNLFELPLQEQQHWFAAFEQSPMGRKTGAIQFLRAGWSDSNSSLLRLFKDWVAKESPELENKLLPYPQDRSIEDWALWALERTP